MRKNILIILYIASLNLAVAFAQDHKLWYKMPAVEWTEALPIGNGRLGAMVYGGIEQETLQLNEATFWSGGPVKDNVNPGAYQYLPQIREVLAKQDYNGAKDLAKRMQGVYSESYLPLANLIIKQDFGGKRNENYRRELNIRNAISTTRFKVGGVQYQREVLASAPDQLIVMRVTADKPGMLNLLIGANSQIKNAVSKAIGNIFFLNGRAPSYVAPSYHNKKDPIRYDNGNDCAGMPFELLIKAKATDGTVTTDSSGIAVKDASEVIIYISAATGFNGFNNCPNLDPDKMAMDHLHKGIQKPWSVILKSHLDDFHHYYDRVSLQLNPLSKSEINKATDERLADYTKGAQDAELESMYFQYARYLLISSSRVNAVPANLQGIWNKEMRPPWSSNYTTNINVQMNYWLAEVCNLSEMHKPLFGLIKNLSVNGAKTASSFYHTNGWVTHHNSDIWALTNPVGDLGSGDPKWANWPMGGDWLVRHLWEHYLFTGDKKFLAETAYPLMKGAAIFTLQWLVSDGKGHLITSPSYSPENDFYYADKKAGQVSISTTMDMGIIKDLFDNLIAASEILKIDKTFRETLVEKKARLLPFKIGNKGQLQEWYKDYEDLDPHHRHVSHLYALYPANQISVERSPALANAARKTLDLRGDDGTGWSLAWKVNFWARLLDGDHAYELYRDLLRLTRENGTNYSGGGGIYPNMFDAHPPFQIDGNFGGASGLAEMLLQSQEGYIHLLPALPKAWQSGQIKGLVARGGYDVNINWQNNAVSSSKITAKTSGICKVLANQSLKVKNVAIKVKKTPMGFMHTFKAKAGKTYTFTL